MKEETPVHLDTLSAIKQLFASIGCEVYAKKGTNANFYMFTICLKCLNAFSTLNLTPVQIRNAPSFT